MSTKKISPHTLYQTNTDTSQHYRLFLDDIIHEGAQLHDILNNLHDAGDNDTLEVRINSGGGYIRYGQQLINVISGKFYGRCITVIEAEASSMASLVFMAGDRRIVYEHSTFMVHDVSMFLGGKSSESKKQLEVIVYTFKRQFERLFKKCLTQEEIDDVFRGVDFWFTAEEMCKRGIATHVNSKDGLLTAEEYLEKVNNPNKVLLTQYNNQIEELEELKEELASTIETYQELIEKTKSLIRELEINENSNSGQSSV